MTLNPFALGGRSDPFTPLARVRADHAVSEFAPLGVWNVLGYAECADVLRDAPLFGSNPRGCLSLAGNESSAAPSAPGLIALDGEDHNRIRRLLRSAFAPRHVVRLEARIVQIADRLLDAVAASGSIEVIADFAHPLPLIVIGELLGVPTHRLAEFRRWSDALVAAHHATTVQKAQNALAAFFAEQIDEKTATPGNDLVSHLVSARGAGSLSYEELIAQCALLLVAGNETTRNLIGNTVLALTEFEQLQRTLASDPRSIPAAIEEVARYYPPVHCAIRYTTRTAHVAGHTIPGGRPMLVWIASANRDPTFFPDADVFDVKRSRNRHLSFGLGVHSCLGAHLGRLEARLAIGALLRRLTNLQRADAAPPEMLPSFMAYGVKHLNVHFEQRPSPTLQEDGNGDGRTT